MLTNDARLRRLERVSKPQIEYLVMAADPAAFLPSYASPPDEPEPEKNPKGGISYRVPRFPCLETLPSGEHIVVRNQAESDEVEARRKTQLVEGVEAPIESAFDSHEEINAHLANKPMEGSGAHSDTDAPGVELVTPVSSGPPPFLKNTQEDGGAAANGAVPGAPGDSTAPGSLPLKEDTKERLRRIAAAIYRDFG